MAYFTGATGKLFLIKETDGEADTAVEIAAVQNWSVSSSVSLISTKTLSQTDDVFTPVGRSTTGSCRILYYQETLGSKTLSSGTGSASTFLNKIIKQRDSTTIPSGASLDQNELFASTKAFKIRLKIDDTSVNGKFIDMRVFITNISLSMSVGDVVAADVQFQCQGAPVAVDI